MEKYILEVTTEMQNMETVMAFIHEHTQAIINTKAIRDLVLAGEELAFNIFSYAYDDTPGIFRLTITIDSDRRVLSMEFVDYGKAFNPLSRQSTDMVKHTGKLEIGGLGIMLSKRLTDKQSYIRAGGCNVLVIEKNY